MFDFDAAVTAPFRMQPGLQRLADGAVQLTALDPTDSAFAEKLQVLRREPGSALLSAPGFDARPALEALARQAQRDAPQALRPDGDRGLAAPLLGWSVAWDGALSASSPATHATAGAVLAALPAERRLAGLASLALHEDLAIVDGAEAALPWLAVCLPSHWVPADKVGRSFAQAHAPVADNALVVNAARQLCALVCREPRWERFVWTVVPHGGHDHHPQRHQDRWPAAPDESGLDAWARSLWFRTERQSFIPVAGKAQAVFTIHVAVRPLPEALETPARAAALHAAIASMSEAVIAYRGLAAARAPLLAWLARRAAA
ncbi:heme-dependent oxidative N-demethylase subunit alpha family protein [Caldimonas sp. KR1-144]|uniref:heme-dependent oxidative N-demethylase subunit alpha family protein n=1 Tax=Caldimonas sp. KR1-144 TaxID=3400911 RepID=UPI003C0D0444